MTAFGSAVREKVRNVFAGREADAKSKRQLLEDELDREIAKGDAGDDRRIVELVQMLHLDLDALEQRQARIAGGMGDAALAMKLPELERQAAAFCESERASAETFALAQEKRDRESREFRDALSALNRQLEVARQAHNRIVAPAVADNEASQAALRARRGPLQEGRNSCLATIRGLEQDAANLRDVLGKPGSNNRGDLANSLANVDAKIRERKAEIARIDKELPGLVAEEKKLMAERADIEKTAIAKALKGELPAPVPKQEQSYVREALTESMP